MPLTIFYIKGDLAGGWCKGCRCCLASLTPHIYETKWNFPLPGKEREIKFISVIGGLPGTSGVYCSKFCAEIPWRFELKWSRGLVLQGITSQSSLCNLKFSEKQ